MKRPCSERTARMLQTCGNVSMSLIKRDYGETFSVSQFSQRGAAKRELLDLKMYFSENTLHRPVQNQCDRIMKKRNKRHLHAALSVGVYITSLSSVLESAFSSRLHLVPFKRTCVCVCG